MGRHPKPCTLHIRVVLFASGPRPLIPQTRSEGEPASLEARRSGTTPAHEFSDPETAFIGTKTGAKMDERRARPEAPGLP